MKLAEKALPASTSRVWSLLCCCVTPYNSKDIYSILSFNLAWSMVVRFGNVGYVKCTEVVYMIHISLYMYMHNCFILVYRIPSFLQRLQSHSTLYQCLWSFNHIATLSGSIIMASQHLEVPVMTLLCRIITLLPPSGFTCTMQTLPCQ